MRWRVTTTTYRQDRETGKLIEVRKVVGQGHFIRGVFQPYVSPIDGTVIKSRGGLAEHNKRHGVSNDLDHLREQAQKSNEKTPVGTVRERKLAIKDAIDRVSSSGFTRRKNR